MSIGEFARMIMRWKWIVIPGLIMAVAAAGVVFDRGEPEYSRSESYLLLAPVQTQEGASNPLLTLGNGVALTASVLAAKVSDGETVADLTADAPGLQYSVGLNTSVAAPLLEVTATDPDPQVVDRTLDDIGDLLDTELAQLQRDSGAPEITWVTIRRLTEDPTATASYTTPLRNAIGAALGCIVLVLLLVTLLERRRRRRLARRPDQGKASPATTDEVPVHRPAPGSSVNPPAPEEDDPDARDDGEADGGRPSDPVRSGMSSFDQR